MQEIMRLQLICVVGSGLLLSSCMAVWGDSHKTEFANASSITFNSDPSFVNMGELQKEAQIHCQQYGKDAVPGKSEMSPWGLRAITFLCVTASKS